MFDGLAGFVAGIVTSAQGRILLAVLTLVIVWGGYKYMTGNHKEGKELLTNALLGAAAVMLAASIAAAVVSMAHA